MQNWLASKDTGLTLFQAPRVVAHIINPMRLGGQMSEEEGVFDVGVLQPLTVTATRYRKVQSHSGRDQKMIAAPGKAFQEDV